MKTLLDIPSVEFIRDGDLPALIDSWVVAQTSVRQVATTQHGCLRTTVDEKRCVTARSRRGRASDDIERLSTNNASHLAQTLSRSRDKVTCSG